MHFKHNMHIKYIHKLYELIICLHKVRVTMFGHLYTLNDKTDLIVVIIVLSISFCEKYQIVIYLLHMDGRNIKDNFCF